MTLDNFCQYNYIICGNLEKFSTYSIFMIYPTSINFSNVLINKFEIMSDLHFNKSPYRRSDFLSTFDVLLLLGNI